jgi:cytochrome c biogenesis protein CcdA
MQPIPMRNGDRETSGPSRYAMLVALVVVVAVAGYAGFVLYPRFDLPAVQGLGLLGLASAAGVASFFSPCSFPLLVTLLGREAAAGRQNGGRPRPALFGAALAVGAGAFMLLVGVVIALGGQAILAGVTFTSPAGVAIRTIVGLGLIALGLTQAGILPFSMHGVSRVVKPILRSQAGLRRDRPLSGFALFGFAYVLAGFG